LTNVPRDPEELRAMYENGNHEWRRAFVESLVDHVVTTPSMPESDWSKPSARINR